MANAADLLVRILGDASQFSQELGGAAKEAEGFGGKVKKSLGIGLAAAGAAGATALAVGFTEALDREQVTDRVASSLGLSGDDSARFGEAAGNLYANAWGESVEEASTAIAENIEKGLVDINTSTQAELERAGALSLDIATAMGEDVTRVTTAAGQLVRNGLAKDAEEAYDILAAGQTNGLNRADDLLDTLNEYAPAFARLGLDGDDALNLINQGLDAGIYNSDKIGDAFNEFSIRAIDGSEASRKAIEDMGLSYDEVATALAEGGPEARAWTGSILQGLKDIEDPLERDAAGVALFGSMWEDMGEDALLAMHPMVDSLEDTEGAASELSDEMNDNLGTTLESLKRKGFDKLVEVGNKYLAPMLESLIELGTKVSNWFGENGIAGAGQLVIDKFNSLGPIMQALVVGLGVAATAGLAYAAALGVVTLATGAWAAITAVAGAAVAVATSPVTLIIAAIAALAAGVYYAYNNFEGFRRVVDGVGRFLRDTLWPIIRSVGEAIGRFLSDPIPRIKDAWEGLKNFFRGLPNWFLETAKKIGSKILSGIKSGLTGAVGFVTDIAGALWRAIKNMVNDNVIDRMNRGIPDSLGWGPAKIDLPDNPIPRLAMGSRAIGRGGTFLVGERGPEMVTLPTGSGVQPSHRSKDMGGMVVNIYGSNKSPYSIVNELAWKTGIERK